MADQNINYKITVDVESGTASLRDLQGKIIANKIPLSELRQEFGNFAKTVNSADFNKFKQGLDSATKSQQNLKNASGGATSAVLELGRVVQDAPYGIRGMANNITQLASQMAFATKSAGSFTGALRAMWTALKGPLGIVLAISVVVSALDMLFGGQKKVKEATDETTESLKKQITPLQKLINLYESLRRVLFNEGDSTAIKSYKNGLLTLDETVKVLTRNFSDFSNAYDKLTESQKKDPEAVKALVDGYEELLRARELEQKQVERMTILRAEIAKNGEEISKNGLTFIRAEKKELDSLEISYIKTQKRLIELESYFAKQSKENSSISKKTISPFKTKGELDIDIKNQENALLEFEKKIKLQSYKNQELEELASAKTEEQKSEIKRRYSQLNLEVELNNEEKRLILAQSNERQVAKDKHDNHVDELKRIFEEYKLKVELNDKLTTQQKQSAISDAKSKTDESIAQAGSELIKTNKEIDDSYNPLFKMFEELAKKRRDALGIVSEDKKTEEFDALSSYIESYKTLMGGVTEFINGEYERQLTIEQNKTNALNAELNNRLLNENLSKDERARIQNEIAQNDEALRIKQNEIAKKQFNTQKAFNIAMAVADTYLAGVKVLADPSFIGRPWQRGIAMAATIASGLASVAAIARQKFQPSAANTPVRTSGGGGSGGGMADRSFNFNLVGNNRENQLANAIQGQFNQPLKAYVVSRDMSNQQQLDANIVNSARF